MMEMVTSISKTKGCTTVEVAVEASGRSGKGSKNDVYEVPFRRIVVVKEGDTVAKAQSLTDGSSDPMEVFELAGREAAQEYLISEIAKVYEMQSAAVNRKHLEIVVRQMFSLVRVVNPGDSLLTTGQLIENIEVLEENARLAEGGKQLIETSHVLMGITDIATNRKSWLSSASFQHTQRVLTSAAVRGTADNLRGLKENVIIGNLIPAGTGINPDFIDMDDIYAANDAEDADE